MLVCVCVCVWFSFSVCYLFICISLQFGGIKVEIKPKCCFGVWILQRTYTYTHFTDIKYNHTQYKKVQKENVWGVSEERKTKQSVTVLLGTEHFHKVNLQNES